MEYKIQKGDAFLCLQDYVMEDDLVAYSKGYLYHSQNDGCITDNQFDTEHKMGGQEDFFDYFKYIPKL